MPEGYNINFKRLLLLSNVLFIALYLILIYYNRYAADDYFFVYNAKTRGIIGAALFTASTWTPRPAEMLLYNTLTSKLPEQAALIVYGLSVLLLLITALYKLLHLITQRLELNTSRFTLNYAILLCCSFFFACFSIGETWFWLCSSAGYLLSLVAFLWGLVFIMNKKNNIATYCLLLICFGYVIGSAEIFSATVLIICWLAIITYRFKNKQNLRKLINLPIFRKTFFVCILSSAALLIIYLGQGTQFRKSLLTQAGPFETLFISAKSMVWLFIMKIPRQLPLLIIFSAPFMHIGKLSKDKAFASALFTKRNLLLACIAFLVLTYISLMPAAYIMSDRGPDRSLTFNALLLTILFAYTWAFMGFHKSARIENLISGTAIIFCLSVLSYFSFSQYHIAKTYSKAIDARIELVLKENANARTTLLELNPLPASGFYYSAELTMDTAWYKNTFFKQRYGLNFDCVVK